MAVPIWVPGTSGDWQLTTNWSTGSAPADTDDVRLLDGGNTINQNMSNPGIDLTSMSIGPDFRGTLDGLVLEVNQGGTGIFRNESRARLVRYSPGSGGVCHSFINSPADPSSPTVLFGSGTVTSFFNERGPLTVEGGIVIPTLRVGGGHVWMQYNAANVSTNIYFTGGSGRIERDWSGTMYVSAEAGVIEIDLKLLTGGALVMNANDRSVTDWRGGNLGAITHMRGLWKFSEISTIGRTSGNVESWAGAREQRPKALFMPTLGTKTEVGTGASVETKA